MRKSILIIGIILLAILPFVSADIPSPPNPTVKDIPIENHISNMDDFPEYVFVVYGDIPGMCSPKIIDEDGSVSGSFYKFCVISVYAVKKSDFDSSILTNNDYSQVQEYFNSSKAVKVIENLDFSKTVSITSTEDKVVNSYNISLNSLVPPEPKIKRDYKIYLYLIIPIVAILIVVVILSKRRK
ncbi:MAG: hypothetical protein KKB21_03520 [Nanoarchaeota archaeon]|nr:hypothetical protein [Nanoarchaeota archaeon]MBU4086617.1 hypothetical protein [Nanoarchaeota archaeon]